MNKIICWVLSLFIVAPVMAAPGSVNNDSRKGKALVATSQRAMLGVARKSSLKFDSAAPVASNPVSVGDNDTPDPEPDNRDDERRACLANNIAAGDIFVWASRNSDTGNYSSMVEDVKHPENNVCFAKIEVRSNDSSINLSDIQPRWFPMGSMVNCASWVDESLLEKRILDGKKSARTLATVAGSLGGAGVGVGAMELFGNKALGAMGVTAVQGQKALEGDELFVSQLKVLKQDSDSRYSNVVELLCQMQSLCKNSSNSACKDIKYEDLLRGLGETCLSE